MCRVTGRGRTERGLPVLPGPDVALALGAENTGEAVEGNQSAGGQLYAGVRGKKESKMTLF